MTESFKRENKMNKINLRALRISLKYRPEILKLILKMRLCIHRKNTMIKKLKKNLTEMKSSINSVSIETCNQKTTVKDKCVNDQTSEKMIVENKTDIKTSKDSSTQTEMDEAKKSQDKKESNSIETNTDADKTGWDLKNDSGEKSIAEQVKEVAQNALQQTGMVYVESAGMYYDYKTGYYYNSELGLYYHTDTGCYYYYSDEKQSFVFHSYPDRSAENPALAAHEKKKAKKHKKEQKKEVDIDNLTKNMSQEEDKEASKPKRKKISKKKIDKKTKIDVENTEKSEQSEEKPMEKDKTNEISDDKSKETNENDLNKEEKEEIAVAPELEDGECSETESETSNDETCKSKASTSTDSDDESVAKHHPPSMRVIVRETNLTKLKVGNLFLITKDGGTIGREGEQHAIVINDHGVSRNHLNIKYDMTRRTYLATDLGSKNGTILNGIRMSESQDISVPMEIMHGSTIQLGETKLLCHIHPGNDTCGHCEPGLIMDTQEKQKAAYTRTCSVQKQHQLELARLKNKYAPKPLMIDSVAYNDRAQARRDTVGSSHSAEKTQSSDLETFIPAENKGFKLLEKMGWSKGEGLGKDNQGDTEPIPLVSNEGTTGLGSTASVAPKPFPINRTKNSLGPATLRLASKTKMLNKPAKVFQDQQDEEEIEK